jgi:formamidopyrimidine-DNA glycosylase
VWTRRSWQIAGIVPELPEVEVAARNLRRWAEGREIVAVRTDPRATRIFRPGTPATLQQLVGTRLETVRRVGKNLLLTLRDPHDGRHRRPRRPESTAKLSTKASTKSTASPGASMPVGIWSHLGMTGKWVRRLAGAPSPPYARLDLTLEDGARLHYVDPRMFGRLRWVPAADFDALPEIRSLGPDPLVDGVDPRRLGERLARSKLPIKVALLDQTLLAGVGNIQASEALFRARLDPRRPAARLSRAELGRLGRAIVDSIAFTLASFGEAGSDGGDADIQYVEEDRADNPFLVYGRAGEPCPRSRRATIVRLVQAQRATFFCPHCQR